MKIAILVPFYKNLPSKTCKCLIDLVCVLPSYRHEFTFISQDNTYIHNAREQIYSRFKSQFGNEGYDWLMHIDSDQTFEFNDVLRLLQDAEENKFDVLSGVYFGRTEAEVTPVLMNRIDDAIKARMAEIRRCKVEEIKGEYYRIGSLPDERFFEVDSAGFGFLACRPKVYQDIEAKFGTPIFPIEFNKGMTGIRGEDVIWCERAKTCGYKIMVDRSVIVGHMGGEVKYRDYKAWQVERWLAKEKENKASQEEKKLSGTGKCKAHKNKPKVCRLFPEHPDHDFYKLCRSLGCTYSFKEVRS